MGTIIGTRSVKDNKIIVEVEMDYEESLLLKGHIKNVHIFSEDSADIRTNLSQRGKNEATKYFLVPKQLRNNLKFNEKVKCQKLETNTKIIFVYVVDKIRI
ncbi:hypothetical protein J4212_00535 [Candidatus Woesearchaeota archaeon]|nr:hypothetical protein [Candidatus Woesearchaeota archaeon]